MDSTNCYGIPIASAIASIAWIIRIIIKEKEKRKRMKFLMNMDASKIEAIGNYEEKSKTKIR